MMMRPLVRWIIGPVQSAGFHALGLSIARFRRWYGDRFDYLVCHNQLSNDQLSLLISLKTPLHRQQSSDFPWKPVLWNGASMTGPIETQPTRNCWKLYPPRLRPLVHEIVLDNDLVLAAPLEELEAFLEGDWVLSTEGLKRSYGRLDHLVRPGLSLNTGFLGFPPGFDLKVETTFGGWQDYFDEQALIACAVQDNVCLIPRNRICYGDRAEWNRPLHHFVGINYLSDHLLWKQYLTEKTAFF